MSLSLSLSFSFLQKMCVFDKSSVFLIKALYVVLQGFFKCFGVGQTGFW